MKRKIITDIKDLKLQTAEVTLLEAMPIINDLEDSLDLTKGIGLSAIQIDIQRKVAIIRIPGEAPINLINPKIIEKEEKFKMVGERCLSLPGLSIDTIRYRQITFVQYGQKFVSFGLEAVAIQHEVDHINGILITDRKWRK